MNKTQRLNAAGAASCWLLAQNPHCNTDSNPLVLLRQSCVLFANIKLDKGKEELLLHPTSPHNLQKAQFHVRREDLELELVGSLFCSTWLVTWPEVKATAPVETAHPQNQA